MFWFIVIAARKILSTIILFDQSEYATSCGGGIEKSIS